MPGPWKQKAASSTFDDRELIPANTYPAVLVALVDLGTVEVRKFQSTETEWVRKVYLAWELTGMAGRPVIGKDFRLSLHTKALLRRFLEGWRGRAFGDGEPVELDGLLGRRCLLKVRHRRSGDNTYHEVESASVASIGGQKVPVPDPGHAPLCWTVEGGDPGELPEWLPYLYGQSLGGWARDSMELSGRRPPPPAAAAILSPLADDDGGPGPGAVDEVPF